MPLRFAARHLSVRRRLAQRRIRQVLARTTAPHALLGPATLTFGAVSVASHVVMTWGLLLLAHPPLPDAEHDPLVQTRFLYPLLRKSPQPVRERISYVGFGGRFVASAPASGTRGITTGSSPQEPALVEPPDSVVVEPVEAYTELEVDITAQRDPESEGPSYPEDLLARKIEGHARVRFVIDSTGRADSTTFGVLEATEAGFAEAVRQALPRMKFRPARMGPRPVPQRVEQTFEFRITPPVLVP
jgi:protein TonB